MPDPSRAVYYAVTAYPRLLYQLHRSIKSVRLHNKSLPIYVALAGHCDETDRAFWATHDVRVLESRGCGTLPPTFMKWHALDRCLPESDLLYLDADTLVFGDLSTLFDSRGDEDFHARVEYSCDPDPASYPRLANAELSWKSHVDYEILGVVATALGGAPLPVWNTGVMLFRNGLAGRLGGAWELFVSLYQGFRRKVLPYPCRHPHYIDEVCASLVLGNVKGLTVAELPKQLCPWFPEYTAKPGFGTGIVLHTGAWYYPACLFEFDGVSAARTYVALPGSGGMPITARQPFLGIGTTIWPCARPAQRMWAQSGARWLRRRCDKRLSRLAVDQFVRGQAPTV